MIIKHSKRTLLYILIIIIFLVAQALPEDVSGKVLWSKDPVYTAGHEVELVARESPSTTALRVAPDSTVISNAPTEEVDDLEIVKPDVLDISSPEHLSNTVLNETSNNLTDGVGFSLIVANREETAVQSDLHVKTNVVDLKPQIPTDILVKYDSNTRVGPGVVYDVYSNIREGESVSLVGWGDGWFEVTNGQTWLGWIAEDALLISNHVDLSQLSTPTVSIPESVMQAQFDAVLIRNATAYTGPNAEKFIVASNYIPDGTRLNLAGRDESGGWVLVADAVGEVGWIEISNMSFSRGFRVTSLPELIVEPARTLADDVFGSFSYGGQTHDLLHLPEMRKMDMSWVKIQYKWREGSVDTELVERIDIAHNKGFKILVSVTGEPYPDDINYLEYVKFLGGVASQSSAPDAIEVWNEMNIDFEWPAGKISPTHYLDFMLAPAYTAIKTANPSIVVISGALAPTGFHNGTNAWADNRYMAALFQAGASDYLDCVGVHYNAGATSPRISEGHPAGSYYGWYFEPSLSMAFRAFEGKKPICITEIGYLRGDTSYGELPKNFWWASETGVVEQGVWLSDAKNYARELNYVKLMVIFSVDILHWDDFDPQAGYALIQKQQDCPACMYMDEYEKGFQLAD